MTHSRSSLRITQNHDTITDPSIEAIRTRLKSALAGESCRAIGIRTGTHPETVRRYLSVGHPSVEFLCGIARGYDISCDWLLLGVGPVKPRDRVDDAMRAAPLSRLLRGVSEKLATAEIEARLPENDNATRLRMTETPGRDLMRSVRLASSILLNSTST